LVGAGAVALTAVASQSVAPHGTGADSHRAVVTDVALTALTPHDVVLALGTVQMGLQEAGKLRTAARINAVQQLSQATTSAVTVALDNNDKAREAIGDELVVALEVVAAPKTAAAKVDKAGAQTGRHAAVTGASQTVKALAKNVEAGVKASGIGRHRKD
jgi:uncharacterized protein (DUF1501 family)